MTLSMDPGLRGCGCALFSCGNLIAAAYVKNTEKTGNGPYACAQMARAVLVWVEARLHARQATASSVFGTINDLILEWPTLYSGKSSRGDARDLFPLAGIDAALAALLPNARVMHYLPREWKGNVDADVMTARIESKLVPEEAARIEPCAPSLRHNIIDGVGVGLKFCNRLEKVRNFCRD